jgi:aldose 1-epimerase
MSIVKKSFGKLADGRETDLYILTNATGASVEITNYGGIIRAINVPDKNGKLDSVVLGYNDVGGYVPTVGYIGALIGRVGNRIANGECELNGQKLTLAKNENGVTHLHGGDVGFNLKLWDVTPVEGICEDHLILKYVSPDGEEDYPGTLKVMVTYTFTDENELILRYEAVSDKDTLCNLTNHTYFNLSGKEQVLDQELFLNADSYLEVDKGLIPTGKRVDVRGTDFDFRTRRPIASGKYDHCFVLNRGGVQAEAWDPGSGRGLRMETDQPAVQLYCGGSLGGTRGKGG